MLKSGKSSAIQYTFLILFESGNPHQCYHIPKSLTWDVAAVMILTVYEVALLQRLSQSPGYDSTPWWVGVHGLYHKFVSLFIISVWKSSLVQSFAKFRGNWTATGLFISRKPKRLDRTAKDRLQPVLHATGCPMNVELDHPIISIYYTSQTDGNWVSYEHYKIMPPNQLRYACKCQ
jgi:hypothetical protein